MVVPTPDLVVVDSARGGRRTPLTPQRLAAAKAAYATRFLASAITAHADGFSLLSGPDVIPKPGDVVLAQVERVGQHRFLELPSGRRASLFPGDEIVVAYGNRYAPDQFEAEVPADLEPAHLVAAGGIASRVLSRHGAIAPATELRPLGLLADVRGVVTLARHAPLQHRSYASGLEALRGTPVPVLAVLGTSMNSGKTTAAAGIVRGLRAAGLRVAAGKVTGTGAGGDPNLFVDSGAWPVLDFTNFGLSSTYLVDHEIVRSLFVSVICELVAADPDVVVLEIADGIGQRETSALIRDELFAHCVDGVVFAAAEALGAVAGCEALRAMRLPVFAATGKLTMSPLATREAEAMLSVPLLSLADLIDPGVRSVLLEDRAEAMA